MAVGSFEEVQFKESDVLKSEKNFLFYKLLKKSFVYSFVQRVLSTDRGYNIIYKDIIAAKAGEKVLDLGCGPSFNRFRLGKVKYTGVDFNSNHISEAKKNYPEDNFVCNDLISFLTTTQETFDKILMVGVLHHLDDSTAKEVISFAKRCLVSGGKLITVDPVFEEKQNPVARLLASMDQGSFVRTEPEYSSILRGQFSEIASVIRRDLLSLPYSHHIAVCTNL